MTSARLREHLHNRLDEILIEKKRCFRCRLFGNCVSHLEWGFVAVWFSRIIQEAEAMESVRP